MLTFKERAYCERRAVQERQAALHARDPIAKAAHLKMARHYELMLEIEHGLVHEQAAGRHPEQPRFDVLPPNSGMDLTSLANGRRKRS